MNEPLVTVITGSVGRPALVDCMNSVKRQTYSNIQHLIFFDGPEAFDRFGWDIATGDKTHVVNLPYPIGNNRWNAHRQYGAGTYIADGDFVIYLDDDNTLDPDHVQSCMDVIKSGYDWSYSFRKIVSTKGEFLCNDDCESLGRWPSVIHPEDYFVDVNCFCLPKKLAIQITPIWYCKFREPGQPEVDRKLTYALRQIAPKFDCTYKYSVNYAVASNSDLSVKPEFFVKGNEEMLRRYNGSLPWQQ